MQTSVQRLNHWLAELPIILQPLSEQELALRKQPDKWSRKEIVGHLCDSALTNIQRFVRAQYESQPYQVLKYAQNHWVQLMDYQSLPMEQIVSLWTSLNQQIGHIIAVMPEERGSAPID